MDEAVSLINRAYRKLSDIRSEWNGRHTREGQILLCNLRDFLSEISGYDQRTIQDNLGIPNDHSSQNSEENNPSNSNP